MTDQIVFETLPTYKRFRNLNGTEPYGLLTVVAFAGLIADGTRRRAAWYCRCSCAAKTIKVVFSSDLLANWTRSCGCLIGFSYPINQPKPISPEYRAWRHMLDRCYNPNCKAYRRYGGRGISVCQRWRDSFANFLSDVGYRPIGLTLDRINNDGNYEPGNVEWRTRSEQSRNTHRRVEMTFNGVTLCMTEWAEIMGVRYLHLFTRRSVGWTDEQSLTIPKRRHRTFKGQLLDPIASLKSYKAAQMLLQHRL